LVFNWGVRWHWNDRLVENGDQYHQSIQIWASMIQEKASQNVTILME
jgi:hypothetical protein